MSSKKRDLGGAAPPNCGNMTCTSTETCLDCGKYGKSCFSRTYSSYSCCFCENGYCFACPHSYQCTNVFNVCNRNPAPGPSDSAAVVFIVFGAIFILIVIVIIISVIARRTCGVSYSGGYGWGYRNPTVRYHTTTYTGGYNTGGTFTGGVGYQGGNNYQGGTGYQVGGGGGGGYPGGGSTFSGGVGRQV